MPTKREPDGSFVRLEYQPADYTVPPRQLATLRELPTSAIEELALHDGMYANYARVREFERDGARWVLLIERGRNWCLEVELSPAVPQHVVPVPPAQAWVIAREREGAAVKALGAPPPGVRDPVAP